MKKVLIIEDDQKIALALQIRLKSVGYRVAVEPAAQSALSAALKFHPDIVLMDINLRDGDGFDVATRMQGNSTLRTTPVIFITASKQAGLKERAADLGAVTLLEKPIDSAKLIQAIEVSQYSMPQCSSKRAQIASFF